MKETEGRSDANKAVKVRARRLSEVKAEKVEYLVDGLIPFGAPTLLAGSSGVGKSTIAVQYIAQVTKGTCAGSLSGKPRNAVIIAPEDDLAAVTRPRLEAAGADLERVIVMDLYETVEQGEIPRRITFPSAIPYLSEMIEEHEAAVVLLDPISSLFEGSMDKREDMRMVMDRITLEILRPFQISMLMIAHNKKGIDTVRGKISGSAVLTDAAKSVLVVERDEERETVVLSVDKASYSGTTGRNIEYKIVEEFISTSDGEVVQTTFAKEIGETETTVAELQAKQFERTNGGKRRNPAQQFIIDTLRSAQNNRMPAAEIIELGVAHGFEKKQITNARARVKDPKINAIHGDFDEGWIWSMETETIPKITKNSIFSI